MFRTCLANCLVLAMSPCGQQSPENMLALAMGRYLNRVSVRYAQRLLIIRSLGFASLHKSPTQLTFDKVVCGAVQKIFY